jgi:hypothetical protein
VVGYYGPAAPAPLAGITELDAAGATTALLSVVPAVDFASSLLPELTSRGSGGLLLAGGLSSVIPMPPLGGLALASVALRTYALTLHVALATAGVYAGTLTIGGLIERGDIHRMMLEHPEAFGCVTASTLSPDDLAELLSGGCAWSEPNRRPSSTRCRLSCRIPVPALIRRPGEVPPTPNP